MKPNDHRPMKRLILFIAIVFTTTLVVSWLNYPLMIFGTQRIAQGIWFTCLGLAAVSSFAFVMMFIRCTWLLTQSRCSATLALCPFLLLTVFATAWFYYFKFLERMP